MAHAHSHDHGHVPAGFDRAFAIGIGLNAGFVAIELAAGIWAGSMALIADAGHNASDVLALVLAWLAAWASRRPPRGRFTYGFGRSSIVASLINAVALLVAAGVIVAEAIERLNNPGPVATGTVIAVASAGIVVNGVTALLFAHGARGDLNVRGAFLHMVADAAVTVGVIGAALLIAATGWLWLDPAVSLIIGAVILAGTWGLLRDSVDLALDAVPRGIDPAAVETFLREQPGVAEVHDLHIWAMSTTETALTAHLVRPDAVPDDGFLASLRDALHHRFEIGHATIQVEAGAPCPQAPAHVV